MNSALKLLSPRYMLFASGVLMLAFTLLPPGAYQRFIQEPNLMFGNIFLYAFIITCLFAIRVGVYLSSRVPSIPVPRLKCVLRVLPFFYLICPVTGALALLALTVAILLRNDPSVLGLALSGQGQDVKQAMSDASQGAFIGSLPLAMGISWWALGEYLNLRAGMSRMQSMFASMVVGILVLGVMLTATLMMSRFVLMPAMFGVFLVYLRHRSIEEGMRIFRVMARIFAAAAIVIGLFILFVMLRSEGDDSLVIRHLIGYGPTSVNHLAGVLDGRFETPGLAGALKQQNFGFIVKFPLLTRFFGEAGEFVDGFQATFDATWRAGLNGSFNWFTALGSIFVEMRLLSPIYFLAYGFVLARPWRSFIRGGVFGLVVYPWSSFGMLLIFGFNIFASNFLSVLLITSALLWVYSQLIRVKQGLYSCSCE